MNRVSTFFALLAEFQTSEIPLENVCEKYFGMSVQKAKQKASYQDLPLPVFKVGSQKSRWLVSVKDLANLIDTRRDEAEEIWRKLN